MPCSRSPGGLVPGGCLLLVRGFSAPGPGGSAPGSGGLLLVPGGSAPGPRG